MTTRWTVPSRDPLLFGDGRPFTATAAVQSLQVAWPSTVAGFVRSRYYDAARGAQASTRERHLAELDSIGVRSGWYDSYSDDGAVTACWLTAPRDCVWFDKKATEQDPVAGLTRYRLVPTAWAADVLHDCPTEALHISGAPEEATLGKPASAPSLWRYDEVETWLANPTDPETKPWNLHRAASSDTSAPADVWSTRAMRALSTVERTHVALEPGKKIAREGAVFATRSLQLAKYGDEAPQTLGVGFTVEAPDGALETAHLSASVATLGGERRVSYRPSQPANGVLPLALPTAVRTAIEGGSGVLRLVLLTPAPLDMGNLPSPEQLVAATEAQRAFALDAAELRVVAAAVGRPVAVSGWDAAGPRKAGQRMAKPGPRAVRWMAPAGSVFWVQCRDTAQATALAEALWMRSIASDQQDRRDGFGLVLVGRK